MINVIKNIRLLNFSTLILIIALLCPGFGVAATKQITGRVVSLKGEVVIGASVVAWNDSTIITGTATDTSGAFRLQISSADMGQIVLRISAIGYQKTTLSLAHVSRTTGIEIILKPKMLEMGAVQVRPDYKPTHQKTTYNQTSMEQAAQNSLVQTNPVSVIKQPHVTREGSSHSSKLWVNGTSPRYSINGIDIGHNPNHYGVFTIIPSPVVKDLQFYAQGTPASLQQPSAVLFETGRPFKQKLQGEFNLSLVEATGSWSIGSERFFAIGSLRKSVLDKLVKQFDIKTGRRTIPPTNFQDIFLSSGVKLSEHYFLMVDQYHVRDFLSYNTGVTSANLNGIDTYLHTDEHYIGTRLDAVYKRMMVKIRSSVRTGSEEYRAIPPSSVPDAGTHLNLRTRHQIRMGSITADLLLGQSQLTVGGQLENINRSEVNLSQCNWNFLPPDANSDNPFMYQPELNELYGEYSVNRPQNNTNLFASYNYTVKNIQVRSGIRWEHFGVLNNGSAILFRQKVTIPVRESDNFSLFYGTFAESPTNRILEPYQVLIHADLQQLTPVKTKLLSAQYATRAVKFGLFTKTISHLPVVTPRFEFVNEDGTVSDGFLAVQSNGKAGFVGGDVSLTLSDLLSNRLDIYSFYGYTHATKTTEGISVPYELSATHQFLAQATYRMSQIVSLSGELAIRSGYTYTPLPKSMTDYGENRYSDEYYNNALSAENSSQFPTNAMLNIRAMFDFGKTEAFLSVSNVTNHSNPIINTTDGYIYDTGILPSIGFTRRF